MRINKYEKVTSLVNGDVLVIDGERGTKSIDPKVLNQLLLMEKSNDEYWEFINKIANAQVHPYVMRRKFYREKNLGNSLTSEQRATIASGLFNDMFIGDYWTINNRVYKIWDFNYWYRKGDTACLTNHIICGPDNNLYTHVMNDSHTTEGGYINSKMRVSGLEQAKDIIKGDFGDSNVLNHRNLFTKGVTNGIASSGDWIDSDIDLMNEIMVYGTQVFTPHSNGTTIPYNYTIDNMQLAIFRLRPDYLNLQRSWFWLRDVVSATRFAYVSSSGNAGYSSAGYSDGVRPVFGIKG